MSVDDDDEVMVQLLRLLGGVAWVLILIGLVLLVGLVRTIESVLCT